MSIGGTLLPAEHGTKPRFNVWPGTLRHTLDLKMMNKPEFIEKLTVSFLFADNSEVDSHKGVNQDLAGLWRQSLFSTTILQTENGGVVG